MSLKLAVNDYIAQHDVHPSVLNELGWLDEAPATGWVNLDFETRSAVNLLTDGAYRYAAHHTTQVICASWSFDGGKTVHNWSPFRPTPHDDLQLARLFDAVRRGVPIRAFNAGFERLIWAYVCTNDHGWPPLPLEQFFCTAAQARANGLPGALDNLGRALKLNTLKNQRGKELIQLLSVPCGGTMDEPVFNEDPELIIEMIDYCDDDVRVEAEAMLHMRELMDREWSEYHANEHVNDRGIGADIAFAEKAIRYSDREMRALMQQLQEATAGALEKPTQHQRVKEWLMAGRTEYTLDMYLDEVGDQVDDATVKDLERGPRWIAGPEPRVSDAVLSAMTTYKQGKRKLSLDKAVRHNLLSMEAENPGTLSPTVKEVVELWDLAGRSSTAKYRRMTQRELNGRLPGLYIFGGAMGTGRFSSVAVQVHNLVRDCVDDFDAALNQLNEYGITGNKSDDIKVIHLLAEMMRPTLMAAPGKKMHWSDWSNIEGRGLPYLANDPRANKKLQLFRDIDADERPRRSKDHPDGKLDVYQHCAIDLGFDPITQRQEGKVGELSFGYGGAEGACQAMARNYNVHLAPGQGKRLAQKWRRANPWAPMFWEVLKDAAWSALASPLKEFKAGLVTYKYTPDTHNGLGTLWCQLPSGRPLAYPAPKFERVPAPWNPEDTVVELTALKANFKPKAGETEWPRFKLWMGLLAENITQAFCADLLRHVIDTAPEYDVIVVGHTHDELVAEGDDDMGRRLQQLMLTRPSWLSPDFPLVADLNTGLRYSK